MYILIVFLSVAGFTRAVAVPAVQPPDAQEWLLKDAPPLLSQVLAPQIIFAPVAGVIQGVAELNPSHGFYIYPMKGDYRELQLGNDRCFIENDGLSAKKPKTVTPLDTLNELKTPIYDYLITKKNTDIFGATDESKPPVAILFD